MTALELAVSEADFQEQVLELAHVLGWKHLHVRRSIGKGRTWVTATNVPWPDLTLWHPGAGGVMFVELKSEKGDDRPGQAEVRDQLAAAGAEVYVWRPSDWPALQARLEEPRRRGRAG